MLLNDLLKTLDVKTRIEIDTKNEFYAMGTGTVGLLLQDFENNLIQDFSKESCVKSIKLIDRVLCITIEDK